MIHDPGSVFCRLTEKQHEALELACAHLTSKQIARRLGVSPATIDKRIDAVRARLGHISRAELLHFYKGWKEGGYDQIVGDPIILPDYPALASREGQQIAERSYLFEDSLTFDARASWDSSIGFLRPGLRPSDLGVGGKLLAILMGAVAILMVLVLSLVVASTLGTLLKG